MNVAGEYFLGAWNLKSGERQKVSTENTMKRPVYISRDSKSIQMYVGRNSSKDFSRITWDFIRTWLVVLSFEQCVYPTHALNPKMIYKQVSARR